MTRLTYYLYRWATSAHYRLSRRFTPAGLLALCALVATGTLSMSISRTLASEAFAFVLCLLAVSLTIAWLYRGRFSVNRPLPKFGSVGHPLVYRVSVRNDSKKPFRDLELLEDLADPRPTLQEWRQARSVRTRHKSFRLKANPVPPTPQPHARSKPAAIPSAAPGGEVDASVEVLPLKRGPLRFQGVTIARPDPFGLVRGVVRVPLPQTVLVLPKRYPLPPMALPGTRHYHPGGVTLAAAIGESEEFVSLRDYRPGDPKRHVHWRSWARTGRPIVKEFQDEFLVRHALILDTFARPEQHEAFEEAVSVAASFACTINTQDSLLDLMFVGPHAVHFTTGRGLGQAEHALEVLAAVGPSSDKPFTALQDLVLQHLDSISGFICILLAWDSPRQKLIRRLQQHGCALHVLVIAEPEDAEVLRAQTNEEKPDQFHVLTVGNIKEDLQQLRL